MRLLQIVGPKTAASRSSPWLPEIGTLNRVKIVPPSFGVAPIPC